MSATSKSRATMQALRVENARLRAAVAVLAAECSNGRTWVADQSTHSGSPYQTYGEYSPEYQAARAATNSNPDAKRAIEEAT